MTGTLEYRTGVLDSLGASPSEGKELLFYNKNLFDHFLFEKPVVFPLDDESFLAAWKEYARVAEKKGAFQSLKEYLVQLNFPIREGISERLYYKSAVRRGVPAGEISEATGLKLKEPESLSLLIHPTPAGYVPIIVVDCREDFVLLTQALSKRNEPAIVPESMGATIVKGYNNWDRINRLRRAWEEEHSDILGISGWPEEFKRIAANKELYQDSFIILSSGSYSNVSAKEMDLTEEEWKGLSLIIRREHECAHYFCLRMFSSIQNNILDEIMADYMGITAAAGWFRADWFLRFMGLENYPDYREGGRLENYKGNPPLSDGAFKILGRLVKKTAENVEYFDKKYVGDKRTLIDRAILMSALSFLTLEELASDEGPFLLQKALEKVKGRLNA